MAPTLPSAALEVSFTAPRVPVAPELSEISAKHEVVLQEPAEHEQLEG
ncbi:hypothetical protein [Vibrio harveyi]